MSDMNSLKEIYKLEYDTSDFGSSLIAWYNKCIDKRIDQLTAGDVARMLRQNILREAALQRTAEIFLGDPFQGEMEDGGILALLLLYFDEIPLNNSKEEWFDAIKAAEKKMAEFDWILEESRESFQRNLYELKRQISKIGKE
ncbi:MAG: hypothetical protein LBH71_04805 [Oscillospiraceae bacterium]|jgi:hypothetical protein|nr:hypothetical protein [Oscillospiraceae bacterium]